MLKIGVIGAGELGETHIEILKEIKAFELIGVFDANQERANKLAQKHDILSYNNVDDLMQLVDVIDIVKPTSSHFEYAVKAMRLSKHVFIEKPVTNTLEEAKKLLELSEEANVKVQIGHVERFNPAFKAALPYISHPMFIESHRMIEYDPLKENIPVVLDLMSHDLDIILSVVNANILNIKATGVEVIGNTPDVVNAIVEFDNGCVANLSASRVSMKNERITKFFQKDAHIKIDYLKKETNLFSLQTNGQRTICSKSIEIKKEDPIHSELEAFAQAIINNTSPIVGILDGYLMLDAAYKVAEKLNYPPRLVKVSA
jgi:predicted dehydrogenase